MSGLMLQKELQKRETDRKTSMSFTFGNNFLNITQSPGLNPMNLLAPSPLMPPMQRPSEDDHKGGFLGPPMQLPPR
jgi:hypothetical protein